MRTFHNISHLVIGMAGFAVFSFVGFCSSANGQNETKESFGASYLDTCSQQGTCSTSHCEGNCCASGGLFGGLIKQSDHAFSDFISPMTNPVFFEDPRSLTEVRPIFVNHKVPLAAGGGDIQLYAVQLRARLSERVSLIATKDGYFVSSNPLIDDGWADLAAGLKFSLVRDACRGRLASAGFTYELPTGEAAAFQGNGAGELHLFSTMGRRIGNCWHWLSASGLRVPMNTTDESTSGYWSNHLDVRVNRRLYLLGETNWYHWFSSGQNAALTGVEGLDVFNFGSAGVSGNDIVTQAFGIKMKPRQKSEVGVAFEFPLTRREDVIDNRLTVDWIWRY